VPLLTIDLRQIDRALPRILEEYFEFP